MTEHRRVCSGCGTANEEDARFCEGCGASLAQVCATCGVEARATARFCRACGAPLQAGAATDVSATPVRKTVTVLFADLAGSTSFEEQVDAETAREIIGRYHDLLRATADRHRAGVVKYIGDGFMAVWGVPDVGPHDAVRAVEAAVALQESFVDFAAMVNRRYAVELALRVSVNTGEVVVGADDADLVSDALNVGARLESECPRGQVVVGEETWRATRGRYRYESLGRVQVKGRSAAVAVYQCLGTAAEVTDATPLVGRTDEIRRLQAVLDDAVTGGGARLVTLIGDPGVGKTRLANEFGARSSHASVLQARCDTEGTVALAPLVEMLRGIDLHVAVPTGTPERDRLLRDLDGLTTGVPGSVEENFWALRRFVEVSATSGPVVLVLDDIQWADTLLLDFIEHLLEWVRGVPVLVLALARPELRQLRPDLVTASRWVAEAIHLDGLDAAATAELAATVLGANRLPDDLLHRLPASTGGNPLFVREFIGMLAHDGVLVEQPNGWRLTIDVDAISIPPTIHALLASRLERLDTVDRRVLEIASVVGSDFSPSAIRALTTLDEPAINLALNRLRRGDLAQPSGSYLGNEPVWRFHHVLIRDVAYRRLLKSERAELHQRLADWLRTGGGATFESDELIARHLEAAHTYRVDLGEPADDLALRAARYYAASARRALDRDELVSAGAQAARGAVLAGDDPAVHADLLLIGCEAFLSAGDVASGTPLVEDLERIAGNMLRPWAICYRCQLQVYTEPSRLPDVDARLQEAIDEFSRRQDPAGLAKAHRVRASARSRLGRIGDCEADLFEALIAARRSGDHRQITAALGAAPSAALWGPSPVPKAGGRCLDVVRMQRMTTAAPSLEATSLRCLAVLELLRGRPDRARSMLADARQVVADLGLRHGLMETELFAGIIESMDGDPVAAEPHFRAALEGLEALGVGADAGQAAALLARSLLAQGRVEEADRYADISEHLAGQNLKTAIAWRAVRAEIISAQGSHDEAVAIARDAAEVARGTDLILDHADACLALSRVLSAAGDPRGAGDARADAERLYAAKEVAAAISRPVESLTTAVAGTGSRLARANRATDTMGAVVDALRAHDLESAMARFSDRIVFDDHRRLSGDAIVDMRAATARVLQHYSNFEWGVLAVRGERLQMSWSRWSDDSGNETTHLHIQQIDVGDHIVYEGRFDEDDFEDAYRELDRRYYAGEGATYALNGLPASEAPLLMAHSEFDRLVGELSVPELRVESRSSRAFPDRTGADLRDSLVELNTFVASKKAWMSVVQWLSPTVTVSRLEREAVGADGERYTWTMLLATEHRDGRFVTMCEFDADDEEGAFAYAEDRVRGASTRMAVTNTSCAHIPEIIAALRARDIEGALAVFAEDFVYDDRRRLGGDPIAGRDGMRAAIERVFAQYADFEFRVLAVRGDRLHLAWSRWSDDDGNEAITHYVNEIDERGRVCYQGRFDEHDFEGAYRELERRFYDGEGAAFATSGAVATEYMAALINGEIDRALGHLTTPDFRLTNHSRAAFPDPSVSDLRTSYADLSEMVDSARMWPSVGLWLSANLCVSRLEQEAVGRDGERYAWTWIAVSEIREGKFASASLFDLDDEEAAFAYAEERTRANDTRLATTNRCCTSVATLQRAMQAGDLDGGVACYANPSVYADHRRIRGDPVRNAAGLRAAGQRILAQYSTFQWRTLAVRGETLSLQASTWSDKAGNRTDYLHVYEVGDDGLFVYEGRFDSDDFEAAYRDLDRRFYTGEGAPYAECGQVATDWVLALSNGDFDQAFGDLSTPDLRIVNRSHALFPDRSAADLRASFEELSAMVSSSRSWVAALRWVSPSVLVIRLEREATGHDGEGYRWTRLHVCQFRDLRLASVAQFEIDDEQAAFAYAAEQTTARASRLRVQNRASEKTEELMRAMAARDVDAAMACTAAGYIYNDHRRLAGGPVAGGAELRTALERILAQYQQSEWRTLAVRGDRLSLHWSRWSDDAGNETAYLHLFEIDDAGLLSSESRFDEDDFNSAYRELTRRYCAGEGAAVAAATSIATEVMVALNDGDVHRAFGELHDPALRVTNRSSSVFSDRTVAEFRSAFEGLAEFVVSVRSWNSQEHWISPTCCVATFQREAAGPDGEQYAWTRLVVGEFAAGRCSALCEFEIDDEEAAFAYAEERVRSSASRLEVANRASSAWHKVGQAMQAHDPSAAAALFADWYDYDDRWKMAAEPPSDVYTACVQILDQYSSFEGDTLAVRGDTLQLSRTRWSNDSGYETRYLYVIETDAEDRICYYGRFGEDDFDAAYRELDHRFYRGAGAAFAEAGTTVTEYAVALNNNDYDRALGVLSTADFRLHDRTRSGFGDRSAADLRVTYEDLTAMMESTRIWHSSIHWLSPTVAIGRFEGEAVGRDGKRHAWSFVDVAGVLDGRLDWACQFDLDDEAAAFAYAEQRVRAAEDR